MKRAFEQEKKLIADHVYVLNSNVKQLESTLGGVNKTLSSIIPEIIVNFEHTKTEFLNILKITSRESVSVFSGYLDSTLETTQDKLSNISYEFVQLGNAFNQTLGSIEENVKIGIDKSIKMALGDKINALENSLNSRFTNVDNKINSLKNSINTEYTSALSTTMSDLKTYCQSAHTAVISNNVDNVESSIMSRFHYLMGHEKQKQKWRFPLFPTLSTYLNYYLRKINRTTTLYKIFICVELVIHPLKTKRIVSTASIVHVCHWVLNTAVKLVKTYFISDTTVQSRSSHCDVR